MTISERDKQLIRQTLIDTYQKIYNIECVDPCEQSCPYYLDNENHCLIGELTNKMEKVIRIPINE